MTLPFTQTLRGHYKVINWPNFNIAVSQGIGRPENRERDGGAGWLVEQSTYTFIKLAIITYMVMV